MRQLDIKIKEILNDKKIEDKKAYFLKEYGTYFYKLGTMEQNQLLNKFPVLPFDKALQIMKNIGQK